MSQIQKVKQEQKNNIEEEQEDDLETINKKIKLMEDQELLYNNNNLKNKYPTFEKEDLQEIQEFKLQNNNNIKQIESYTSQDINLSRQSSYRQVTKNRKIIHFNDPLITKIMKQQNMGLIEEIAKAKNLNLRLKDDKKLEIFGQQDLEDQLFQQYTQEVQEIVENCEFDINQTIKKCELRTNTLEFNKILKVFMDENDKTEVFPEITFYNEEGEYKKVLQSQDSQQLFQEPMILNSYVINGQIIIKIATIPQPKQTNLQHFDLISLNQDKNNTYLDDFGYQLATVSTDIQKQLKKQKKQKNQMQLEEDNKDQEITQEFEFFQEKVQQSQQKNYVFIQKQDQSKKLDKKILYKNLFDNIIDKINQQTLEAKGFLTIGLAAPQQDIESSIQYIRQLINALIQIQQQENGWESYINFPTEYVIFISENYKEPIQQYFTDVLKKKSLFEYNQQTEENNKTITKGGQWFIQNQQHFQNRGLFGQNQMQNQNQNQNLNALSENNSIILEKLYLKVQSNMKQHDFSKKMYIIESENILQPKDQYQYADQYNRPFLNQKKYQQNDDDDEENPKLTCLVNLQKMTENMIESNIERSLFYDEKMDTYSYIDTINQKSQEYEEPLQIIFRMLKQNKIESYTYNRNLIDYEIRDKIYEVDIVQLTIKDIKNQEQQQQQQQYQNNQQLFAQPVYMQNRMQNQMTLVRKENEKYNYLLDEFKIENQDLQEVAINNNIIIEEQVIDQEQQLDLQQNNNKKKQQKNNLQNISIFRGLDKNINIIKQIYENKITNKQVKHTMFTPIYKQLNKEYLQKIGKDKNIKVKFNDNKQQVTIKGYKKSINQQQSLFQKSIYDKALHSKDIFEFPQNWEKMEKNENLKKCLLDKNSQEFKDIEKQVHESSPSTIIKIYRIQNKKLWQSFCFEKQKLRDKGNDTIKQLFHGTRNTDPGLIYKGEDGFDFRMSNAGAYGRGAYFAVQASYSIQGFGYRKQNGNYNMFLSDVLVGQSYNTGPGQFNVPPYLPGSQSDRYDSICGNNIMYIVYNNSKAYPSYLIEYSHNQRGGFYGGGFPGGGFPGGGFGGQLFGNQPAQIQQPNRFGAQIQKNQHLILGQNQNNQNLQNYSDDEDEDDENNSDVNNSQNSNDLDSSDNQVNNDYDDDDDNDDDDDEDNEYNDE